MGRKLECIRESLEREIGNKVRVTTKEGRKKIVVRRGIIEQTYPSLFVVRFENRSDSEDCRTSFSYIDVLTHNIELAIYKPTTA